MDYNSSFNVNFPKIDNRASGNDVRTDEGLRKFLVEVGINEGEAYKIDQFFHNDLPSSNLQPQQQRWAEMYYDIISGYLIASTTSAKSGRRYDWTPLILKAYERAKTMAIISKAGNGWATLNVLKREMIQRYHEESDTRVTNEQRKKHFWQNNNQQQQQAEAVGYGNFEKN